MIENFAVTVLEEFLERMKDDLLMYKDLRANDPNFIDLDEMKNLSVENETIRIPQLEKSIKLLKEHGEEDNSGS